MDYQKLSDSVENLKLLLKRKNERYGDSFYKSLDKYGDSAFYIRLEDKINRMENLFKDGKDLIDDSDESLIDTIIDIAGYCMLYITYKKEGGDGRCS